MRDDLLTFKRWDKSDIDNLVHAVNSSPNLSQWVPWAKDGFNELDAKGWVKTCEDTWKNFRCFVVYKGDDLVGSVSSSIRDIQTTEIGYWVATPFRRQGICERMIKASVDYSFNELNSQYARFKIAEENNISQYVVEKIGAILIGIDTLHYGDRVIPAFIYQIERNND